MTPDRVSAWAVGIGIGFAALTVTWIILNRLTSLWLSAPEGPVVSLTAAILVGVVVSLQRGSALSRRVARPDDQLPDGPA
jgi:hypothetical protein